MLYPLDLHFLGLERAIGVYVVETDDGLALHDCGPATTLPRLEEACASSTSSSPTSATCCSRTSTSTTRARPGRSCGGIRS